MPFGNETSSSSGAEQTVSHLRQIVDRLPPHRRRAFHLWCQAELQVIDERAQVQRTEPISQQALDVPPHSSQAHLSTPIKLSALQDTAPPAPEIRMAGQPIRPGTLIDGRYALVAKVGEGAYSTVYRAKDTRLNTFVAVKLLKAELSSEASTLGELGRIFSREAQIQAPLNHPNIVRVLDANVTDNGTPYIVTEFVDGRPLNSLLASKRPLPLEQVRDLLKQLCSAVQYAHDENVIHRDLKPGNMILVQERGQLVLKVLDFGLAMLLDRAHLTLSRGAMVGTPAYMSPEQWQDAAATPLSDVYAVAIILYEMVTGRLPFGGEDLQELARQHRDASPPDPSKYNPDLPRRAANVILKSLNKVPDRRAPSAATLCDSFEEAFLSDSSSERPRAKRPRKAAPLTLAVIVVGLIAFAGYALFWRNKQPASDADLQAALETIERDPSAWRKPLKLAIDKLGAERDPKSAEMAQNVRQRAIAAARTELDQLRSQAKQANAQQANKAFEQARKTADELVAALCNGATDNECDATRELKQSVFREWIDYGQSHLQNDAAGAQLTAETILKQGLAANDPIRGAANELLENAKSSITEPITGGPEKVSDANRLTEAVMLAEAGDWTKAQKVLDGLDTTKLNAQEKTLNHAIGSLSKSLKIVEQPDKVLDELAGIDLNALAPDSWVASEIDTHRSKAIQDLLRVVDDPTQNRESAKKILQHYPDHIDALFKLIQAEASLKNYDQTITLIDRARPLVMEDPAKRLQLLLQEAALVVQNSDSSQDTLRRVATGIRSEMARTPGSFELLDALLALAASTRIDDAAFDQAVATLKSGRGKLAANDQKRADSRFNTEASKLFREAEQSEKDSDIDGSTTRYRRAMMLHTKPPLNYLLALARTATQSKKQQQLGSQVYDQLITEHFDELSDPYDIMLKSAQLLETVDKRADALARYAQITDYRDDRKHNSFYKQARTFYAEVIAPGRKLSDGFVQASKDRAAQKAAARIYGAGGILILDNDWEDWKAQLSINEPLEEALTLLTTACELYPEKDTTAARLFTKLGFARKRLAKSRGKLDEAVFSKIEKDANAALEADPEYPGGHHLSADVLLDRAELEADVGDYDEAKRQANASIEKLSDAAKGKENDPQAFSYFHNRSIAWLMLGHYYVWSERSPNLEQVRTQFDKSVADATIATRLRPEDPNGWAQLGNASEDLAWSRFGKKTNGYPAACKAFEQQIEKSFDSARAHTNLARCLLKWILDEPKDPPSWPRLSEADEHLAVAMAKDPLYFETTFWTGILRLLQNDQPKAIDAFAQSLTCPSGKQNWPRIVERVGLAKSGVTLADLKSILDKAIPENPTESSTWLLLNRSGILLRMSVFDTAYKEDLDMAFALAKDKKTRAELYNESILMHRWARDEAKRQRQNEKADAFNKQATLHIEQLVSMYMAEDGSEIPPIARLSEWAQLFANELVSRGEGKKAIDVMDLAIKYAPANKQEALRRIQNQIRANLR